MNNSNRKLPRVRIGAHVYEADFENSEFRQVSNRANTIAMYKLHAENDRFTFWYDNQRAKAVDEPATTDGKAHVVHVVVPIVDTDPQYFKEREKEENEARSLIRAGKSIYNNEEGIHAPIPTMDNKPSLLPIVNFYGTDFFLDLRLKEFRQVDDPTNRIAWKALGKQDFHFQLLYDAHKKNEFSGSIDEISKGHVKLINLPPLDKMIHDGVARHQAMVKARIDKMIRDKDDVKKSRQGKRRTGI